MQLHRSWACVLVVCSGVVAAAGGAQQAPPPPPAQATAPVPVVGTSRISGRVIASDNGAPVKRARVSIFGMPFRPMAPARGQAAGAGVEVRAIGGLISSNTLQPSQGAPPAFGPPPNRREVETDETGRFEFSDLPAGRYSVNVMPQGGFARSTQPQPLTVADGEAATITITLERAGAIKGRIVDETGDPIARVQVRPVARPSASGARPALMGGLILTDDRGEFRIYDLAPGEYLVNATYANPRPPGADGPAMGYASTFYPGAPSAAGARAVAVRSGQDTTGVDFAMIPATMGRISGIARDAAGELLPSRGGHLSLMPRADEAGPYSRGGGVWPDGSFVIADIPPGDYYLHATLTRGEGPQAAREAAYVPVTVNGDDQTINIRTNLGATVAGRVVVEGKDIAPPLAPGVRMPPLELMRMSVNARPVNAGAAMPGFAIPRPAPVAEDGTFELAGLRGQLRLTLDGRPLTALKSVVKDGKDLLREPLELRGTEQIRDVLITVTREVGRLEGTVTDAQGEPVSAWVVVFPEDERTWYENSPFIATTRSTPARLQPPAPAASGSQQPGTVAPVNRAGRFSTSMLLPGRYAVAALAAANDMSPRRFDRELLAALRPHATSVIVTAGESTTVYLKTMSER